MRQLVYMKWFIALFLLYGNNIVAQTLVSEDLTDDNERCTYKDVYACVTVIADKSLDLGFNTNLEKPEQIVSTMDTVIIGSLIHYILHFKTGQEGIKDYTDRTLEIIASKYPNDPLEIPLYNLQPKESLKFAITLTKCYEPLFSEGNTLFFAGKYQEAREKYVQAIACADKKSASLIEGDAEKKIVRIDTIMSWITLAAENMLFLNCDVAIKYYDKVLAENSTDQPTIAKKEVAVQKQLAYCGKYEQAAYRYFKEYEYDKALELYKKAVDQNCYNKYGCQAQIDTINKIIDSQRKLYKVLTYEFGVSKSGNPKLNLPISLSIGKYPDYKTGGYFSFATNPAFFNMLRSDYSKAVQSNFGVSFGFNLRPVKPKYSKYFPVWLFFGTGYTFRGAYHYTDAGDENMRYEGGDLPEKALKLKPYHAVPFETGLLLKIKRIALRYTFQYRFAIKLDTQEYVNPYIHSFGIGFCY
jgi:tetratricopeptide (TPR) repeat protein